MYLAAQELDETWRPDKACFMIWTGQEARRLTLEADIDLGPEQRRPIESGCALQGGGYRPYARYIGV